MDTQVIKNGLQHDKAGKKDFKGSGFVVDLELG